MTQFAPDCLKDRVALVTGGSRGLGRDMVLTLARYGAKVAFSYVQNAEAATSLEAEVKANGGVARGFKADVTSRPQIKAMLAEVSALWGGLDILVNNAGINRRQFFEETTDEDWDAVIDTNLKGPFICSQEALPYLKESKYGRIINISSIASQMAGPKTLHYAVSKSGLDCMTRYLGRYCGPYQITVNSINPGIILTDQTRDEVMSPVGQTALKETPLGRAGELHDVSSALVFLASDEAAFITGHILSVNGGRWL